jgi:hypothetical protein
MLLNEIKQLRAGDEVYWNDPDNDLCSRYLIVDSYEIFEDLGVVVITDIDGDVVSAFFGELE